ncbi:serine protease [Vibrio parahaemolyticus]|uniref:Serine protease n=1 Tax=Vibrio parahaemolyticus TaxID=670 RepID=A0AAW8PZK7_VIBPH|nr:serine protease [Vibrio parahaemolyticus]MDS1821642.1 serine protease [Vibrio parahaemolyticus]
MKLKFTGIILSLGLMGCSNGTLHNYNSDSVTIDTQLIGIPWLLGGYGSSIPLTEDLSLTAKHVASYDYSNTISYHPTCDVAIIERENRGKNIPSLGTIEENKPVKTFGRSIINPYKTIYGKGVYLFDIHLTASELNDDECLISLIDAPVQIGMSGGGVINEKGELVGIISSFLNGKVTSADGVEVKRASTMISTKFIEDWIKMETKKYYEQKKQ